MLVKNLGNIAFEEIIECFLEAFTNYYVEMPADIDYYKKRWKVANVNFNYSYGMFENDKLIGFIINAIDERNGFLTAYNTGTGVIPKYRGQKIIKQIYEFAIPELRLNGIEKCLLEVITENEFAIKSYQSIGFEITRTLRSFGGSINSQKLKNILVEKPINTIYFEKLPNQQYYSWDFCSNSINRNSDLRYFQIENNNSINSYFIINDSNGYIAQFELLDKSEKNWDELFSAITSISKDIKIINIDTQFQDKITHLKALGLKNIINQYEMEMAI